MLTAVEQESEFIQPSGTDADIEMHVDEEGRPRFAPAKDTVKSLILLYDMLLTQCRAASREPKFGKSQFHPTV